MNAYYDYAEMIESCSSLKLLIQRLNLMPDQLEKGTEKWDSMLAIVQAYEIGWQAGTMRAAYHKYFQLKKQNKYVPYKFIPVSKRINL